LIYFEKRKKMASLEPFRLRKRVNKAHFSALPQPEPVPPVPVTIHDDYLKGLENFIDQLSQQLLEIQKEEIKRTTAFTDRLKAIRDDESLTEQEKIKRSDEAKKEFAEKIREIRDKRKQWREILYDAMQDRQGLWDSAKIQKDDEILVQRKVQDLALLPVKQQTKVQLGRASQDIASFVYALAQILFIIGFSLLTSYENLPSPLNLVGTPNRVSNYFTFLIFIMFFVFIGMTFLQAYLKKFGFGATLGQVLVGAFAFQWSIFVFGFFLELQAITSNIEIIPGTPNTWHKLPLGIDSLIYGVYGAGGTLIAIGSTLGKVKPIEQFLIAFFFVPAMGVNWFIGQLELGAIDTGFSIFVFTFAGVWAMTYCVVRVPKPEPIRIKKPATIAEPSPKEERIPVLPKDLENNDSSYNSDIFSTLGALVMFVTFPAWNAAFAPDGTQYRAVINTIFALLGATIFSFLFSRTFRGGKFRIGDIRAGIISGGISMASITNWLVTPGGALVTGAVAGSLAVILYANIGAAAYRAVSYDDTIGSHALYAFPGFVGALGGIIAAAVHIEEGQTIYGQTVSDLFPNHGVHQAGWNTLALLITIGIAVGIGALVAILARLLISDEEEYYTDDLQWIVPPDFDCDPKFSKVGKELRSKIPAPSSNPASPPPANPNPNPAPAPSNPASPPANPNPNQT